MITLVTGGARSGKSRHALELAEPFARRVFIATAEAFDEEMNCRIRDHQRERGTQFHTMEESRDLVSALNRVPSGTNVVVVDCLTVWLGNLMYAAEQAAPEDTPSPDVQDYRPISSWLQRLEEALPWRLILVTNELGMGIVPASPLSRAFRDLAGRVNQEAARRADEVILMVSGLPMIVKGPVPHG